MRAALLLSMAAVGVGGVVFAQAPCSISGRVTDDRGKPARFAVVNALRETWEPGNRMFGGVSNERGEYCISGLNGGYRVRAMGGGKAMSAAPSCGSCCEADTGWVATFYPGVVQVGGAKVARSIDIRLRREAVFCVRGEVRDRSGGTARAANLVLEGGGIRTSVLSEGGRFLLTNLARADYTLFVMDGGQFGRVIGERRFTVRDQNIQGLVIRLR